MQSAADIISFRLSIASGFSNFAMTGMFALKSFIYYTHNDTDELINLLHISSNIFVLFFVVNVF